MKYENVQTGSDGDIDLQGSLMLKRQLIWLVEPPISHQRRNGAAYRVRHTG